MTDSGSNAELELSAIALSGDELSLEALDEAAALSSWATVSTVGTGSCPVSSASSAGTATG